MKEERRRFRWLIILDIIISVADIVSLAAMLWIVKFYLTSSTGSVASLFPAWLNNNKSFWLIGLFFLFYGVKNLIAFIVSNYTYQFIGKVAVRLSEKNLERYQEESYSSFINVDSSVFLRQIAFDPFEFCQSVLGGFQQMITQAALIILSVVAILLFNAELFLLLLIILMPPVAVVFYVIKRRSEKYRKAVLDTNQLSFRYLLDALKGFVEANIFNSKPFFRKRFLDQRRKYSKDLFGLLALQTLPSRVIEVFALLGLFILIMLSNGDSSSLLLVGAFGAAAYKIIPGTVKLINIAGQIKGNENSLKQLLLAKESEAAEERASDEPLESVQLKNISFQYGELSVVNKFSLCIQKGDFIGVTGKSGKGKSTLLNILLGFLQPTDGQVLINGRNLNSNELKNFWNRISYSKQQPFFIHDSIEKNITLHETFNQQKLDDIISITGIADFLNHYSEGIQKVIAENGKNISGGQQKRIALARALYKDADLLLLDEPFNELDEASAVSLSEHLLQLAKEGKIIVLITHQRASLSYCTNIISLDE